MSSRPAAAPSNNTKPSCVSTRCGSAAHSRAPKTKVAGSFRAGLHPQQFSFERSAAVSAASSPASRRSAITGRTPGTRRRGRPRLAK